ncbi:MAG: DNA polymerase I [Pseudomonadota bacterium]|nr:DNA polymerase I [Pseudomonadota bacterium]
MKKLLLIDGSSYLYRAYHALPDLRSPDGTPTGAMYGVLNMLRRIHKDYTVDYSACVFDAKGPTFRNDLDPEYKATRPPMPDNLRVQINPLYDAINAMGWPFLVVNGVEADDVIGTLAHKARNLGIETLISTGDKDLAQLVSAETTLINTMTGEKLDEAGVQKKFGVPPGLIVDFLALTGDKIDNIRGVNKCGPKTAIKWLCEYGSLENLMEHASEIPGNVGDNLRLALDWLPLSKNLATIRCDLDLDVSPESLIPKPQDNSSLDRIFRQSGFKSWLTDIQPSKSNEEKQPITPYSVRNYETVTTETQLEQWISKIQQYHFVCIDTETTSLDAMEAKIVGLSFALMPHEAAYVPLAHINTDNTEQIPINTALKLLKPLLENPDITKIGQNLKYDRHVFLNHNIRLEGILHDTMLESYVLEAHLPHNMDALAKRHLNETTITYEEVAGKGTKQIKFEEVAIDLATAYAAEDADITLQLHQQLWPQIQLQQGLNHIYSNLEIPLIPILGNMERHGVLIDTQLLMKQSHDLGLRMLNLEQQAYEAAEGKFNLNSPKQIGEILFGRLGLPIKRKTPSGAASTDESVLELLAPDYPLPKILLEYRSLAKLKSTYTDKLPRSINLHTGRVHTNYSQSVAITGRLASSDPNLQNIPVRTIEGRRIREAFIAPAHHLLVAADYSQVELRIMAHLSQDASLIRAFREGQDIHQATAAEIFGHAPEEVTAAERRAAKAINFGLIYGMSSFGLANQLSISRLAAQSYIDRYFTRYPGVADYMQKTRESAKRQGYVETLLGRKLWLPEITASSMPRRQAAERAAINAPMQGTAADIIKLAMIEVETWIQHNHLDSRLIMQVHDELVLEVPENEVTPICLALPELMCNVITLDIPLEVSVGSGNNWESAH